MMFRKHEWDKHGTCAMSMPSLNSELKYFSAGLNLSSNFDLLKYVFSFLTQFQIMRYFLHKSYNLVAVICTLFVIGDVYFLYLIIIHSLAQCIGNCAVICMDIFLLWHFPISAYS